MKNSPEKIRTRLYLLLLYFFLYQHLWFGDLLGRHYYVMIHIVFIISFLWITGCWRTVMFYYSFNRINKRSVAVCSFFLLLIIVYRLSQFYLFHTGIRPGMIAVVHENGPLSVITPVEDLFFIGIVFVTVRTAIRAPGRPERRAMPAFVIPFIITFYWFLLPHQYSNHFLDPAYGFVARIRDFPVDILFGFLCGTLVFVKTRSLILAGICHVIFNGLVWWYVAENFPL